MATKKTKDVESVGEIKKDESCEKCGFVNCVGGKCVYANCSGGVCSCPERPCRSWGWRIISGIFRMILMLLILAIVFSLGAAIGGAGMMGYINDGDFSFGPGMMRGDGIGSWTYKFDKLSDSRLAVKQMMYGGDLKSAPQNSLVRIFGNILEVRSGELTILDNSGKNVDVVSGSFTIIETSKGEIGLKDLKVDEGVTVYGLLTGDGTIKASNIRVSR